MPMTRVKKERLEAIGDLITERRSIGSQAELVDLLQERGFKVTQSSVSRDLQDLGVKRVNGRYVLKPWRQVGAGDFDGLVGFVHQATRTGPNLTVIVTSPNAAKMVAEAIHSAAWPEVVGIVTGDDTLFVATINQEDQTALFGRLSQYLKRN
jgi:transcriptional regulator of arginine metabolism